MKQFKMHKMYEMKQFKMQISTQTDNHNLRKMFQPIKTAF